MLFQKFLERLVHHRFRRRARLRIAELGLRLPLELRIAQYFTETIATSPSRMSSARQVLVFLFQISFGARKVIERTRERRPESGEVHAALRRIDIVRKTHLDRASCRPHTGMRTSISNLLLLPFPHKKYLRGADFFSAQEYFTNESTPPSK